MIGLKTYLPQIAPLLGMSTEMAYERQRALVREGLLKPRPGRGPGSGVTADENSLAVLLISILSHDLLTEAPATKVYCELRNSQDNCPVTGATTFRETLSTLLANPVLPAETILVEVMRGHEPHADVSFVDEDMDVTSTFHRDKWRPFRFEFPANKVFHIVQIDQDLLRVLAEDIAQFKRDGAS